MFQKLYVECQFQNRVYGGLPLHPRVVESYINAKFGEENADLADKISSEVAASEEMEKITTGFKRDEEHGLYISDYQIKAMMKQCGSLLGLYISKRRNPKGVGAKESVKEGLYVKPVRIYLDRMEPDGVDEFFGAPRGTGIRRRAEYVERAAFAFDLWRLEAGNITREDVRAMLELGQEVGLGSMRSFESGKFEVLSIVDLESE